MKKYASYSKILEDIRILESRYASRLFPKRIRVPTFDKILNGNKIFIKKTGKNSRFCHFCPLIISTKGDTMINNMVLSREIEWIGYEHKRNMLQVEFIVGSIYQYENVPETVYQEFLTAPSHGRFFESNIKNKYQVRKVR